MHKCTHVNYPFFLSKFNKS